MYFVFTLFISYSYFYGGNKFAKCRPSFYFELKDSGLYVVE